jgi:signal transduction histidine kinase
LKALVPALPRTLAGRVLLILFTGLVVALAASLALFAVERARAFDRFAANDIAARIVENARSPAAAANPLAREGASLRDGGPPHEGGSPREGGFRSRLGWREVASLGDPPSGAGEASRIFTSELKRLVSEGLGSDPVVWIATRSARRPPGNAGTNPRPPGPGGFDRGATLVTVALDLPDGRKALAEAMSFQPSLQVSAEAWVSVLLLFAVTALFSIWAVRLALQPVRILADAAERLSRNIAEPPLPEEGGTEIRAAARAFNRMQDRLRRHVNTRALAFAAMSHDIRTPLTRMRLRLETLSPHDRGRIEEDLAEIEAIARSVLEATRELASEEAMEEVDLHALVRRVVDDQAQLGASVALSGTGVRVRGRAAALRRAVANLVENAIKYGAEVAVELEASAEHALVRVCDRGPGIAAEHLDKVVHPFYRVEPSRNRDTGGTGLGLAIAKDIVEGHGGELVIENREGGGLCATIRLPR